MWTTINPSSLKRWRAHVNSGLSQKHPKKHNPEIDCFECSRHRSISGYKSVAVMASDDTFKHIDFTQTYTAILQGVDAIDPIACGCAQHFVAVP